MSDRVPLLAPETDDVQMRRPSTRRAVGDGRARHVAKAEWLEGASS
jgi:hypothetical protein